jgi:hypothetical protein
VIQRLSTLEKHVILAGATSPHAMLQLHSLEQWCE